MLPLDAEGTHRPGGSVVLGTWKLRAETRAEVKLRKTESFRKRVVNVLWHARC